MSRLSARSSRCGGAVATGLVVGTVTSTGGQALPALFGAVLLLPLAFLARRFLTSRASSRSAL